MHQANLTSILTSIEPLSTSQRKGIVVVVVFTLLSSLAFVFMAVRTIRGAAVLFLSSGCGNRPRPPEILFFRTQLGLYAGCLILSNAFISAAGLINLSWLAHSGLSRGVACSAQAVLMQIGMWGTCWFTAAHGVHTLIALVFRFRQARWRSIVACSVGWTITFVAALAPLQERDVYGPNGITCRIAHSHRKEKFFLGALPIILGAFVSISVYTVSFIVLHGKQNASSTRKPRSLCSINRRGTDAPEEYHKFITTIIWTMFWFPLAFVLLLAPSCVIYILLYAGYTLPFVFSVFADVCTSILGLVNVCLLCNTFQVICPMSRVAADTVMTFGHDASGESPTVPHLNFRPRSTIPLHGSSRTYNTAQMSPHHSRNSSWSSVDSSTGLSGVEKASYGSMKTKAVPPGLHITHPAELNRQFDSKPSLTSPHNNTKSQGVEVIAGSPLYTISLSPCPPRVVCLTGDAGRQPVTQDKGCSFEQMADPDTFGEDFLVIPLTDKSPTFATQVSVPDVSAPAFSKTLVPRLETNLWSEDEDADESNPRHFSCASYATTTTLGTDCGSRYSGEIMHAYKIRPDSQFPQPSDDDEGRDTVGSLPPERQRRTGWLRRITRASVWSQESGHNLDQPPDEESPEAYWQVIDEFIGAEVMSDEQVDAEIGRRATFARPQTLRIQPTKATSRPSVHFADTSNIKSSAVPKDSAI